MFEGPLVRVTTVGALVVLLQVLSAAVVAAPRDGSTTPVAIVSQSATRESDGSFVSAYESADGSKVEDQGVVKTIDVPDANGGTQQATVVVQHGTYSYIAPDGTPISTQWSADEGGFRAQGAHLPVAPGVGHTTDQGKR